LFVQDTVGKFVTQEKQNRVGEEKVLERRFGIVLLQKV